MIENQRIVSSPSRYIQGPGALDQLGAVTRDFGKQPLVVTDEILRDLFRDRLSVSFDKAGQPFNLVTFPGEVTRPTIDRLTEDARRTGVDLVVGFGGGKALDTGKGVALFLGVPFISVPTIAATDAPASFAIAVYDDHHFLSEILMLPRNPEVVLVDSAVIAGAPLRFLLAGIGDAISKKFEAQACHRAGRETPNGTRSTRTGLAIANACYDLIRAHAAPAIAAVKAGQISADNTSDDLESLLEATVLLSTVGFENAGLSVSHAIAKGLPMVPRAEGTLHGEHVAYGLLVHLVLEERPVEFILELVDFYRHIGLPTTLADFGLTGWTEEELDTLTANAMLSPSVKRFEVTLDQDMLKAAIRRVEDLVTGH
jgi:glycerol dehydrogenase